MTLSVIVLLILNFGTIITLEERCNCYMLGTLENWEGLSVCNPSTEECECLRNVQGKNCDKCSYGSYNILSGAGCIDCKCYAPGTVFNTTCDSKGQCNCKEGYTGYRCDISEAKIVIIVNDDDENCLCEDLLKKYVEIYEEKLKYINGLLENTSEIGNYVYDIEIFERRLCSVKELIDLLYTETIGEKKQNITNNIQDLINEILYVQKNLTEIIKQVPKNILIINNKKQLREAQKLFKVCKQHLNTAGNYSEHDDEITKLAQQATALANKLEPLPSLMQNIFNSYRVANESIKILEDRLDLLRDFYEQTKMEYLTTKRRYEKLYITTKKTENDSLRNRGKLNEISFPFYNSTRSYCFHNLSSFNYELNKNLENKLLNTKQLQDKLTNKHQEMLNTNKQAENLEKENEKDIKSMEIIYNNYINLIEDIVNNIILKIHEIIDNESDFKIIENELNNLIYKLELFSAQLSELENLSERNSLYLQKFGDDLADSYDNIEKLKDLIKILDALPLSKEELDEIEREIEKAERYFGLLREKHMLEKELENLEAIVRELDALGDPKTLCDDGVREEGKNVTQII